MMMVVVTVMVMRSQGLLSLDKSFFTVVQHVRQPIVLSNNHACMCNHAQACMIVHGSTCRHDCLKSKSKACAPMHWLSLSWARVASLLSNAEISHCTHCTGLHDRGHTRPRFLLLLRLDRYIISHCTHVQAFTIVGMHGLASFYAKISHRTHCTGFHNRGHAWPRLLELLCPEEAASCESHSPGSWICGLCGELYVQALAHHFIGF